MVELEEDPPPGRMIVMPEDWGLEADESPEEEEVEENPEEEALDEEEDESWARMATKPSCTFLVSW